MSFFLPFSFFFFSFLFYKKYKECSPELCLEDTDAFRHRGTDTWCQCSCPATHSQLPPQLYPAAHRISLTFPVLPALLTVVKGIFSAGSLYVCPFHCSPHFPFPSLFIHSYTSQLFGCCMRVRNLSHLKSLMNSSVNF